ncbi:hypothetical protein OJ996_00155 [Luteolibacter sp. GHJ8]|jgi:hypothetical protein|uniref:Uncharacterized protein n=1 Tax=Luteolibacter rhizosphaerae TaxID=2989719 RepID=A0ABT3FX98_9BACT|nr:hypothetical protein [Luteolibacter rhizosphaerae]MCW1911964.1 hypothetical protein [Luteolibacter rhizosphaerae]
MNAPILNLSAYRSLRERMDQPLRQTFILVSLVLFVLAAAFPAEGAKRLSAEPFHPLCADEAFHLEQAPTESHTHESL